MEEYHDYLVRALACNEEVRAFAVTSKDAVEYARKIHNNSPIATACLGRMLSAGLMMGDMLKSNKDLVTIQIHCDGPLKHVLVTANDNGEVKGYVSNPNVILPPNASGHLNVGGGIGKGTLTVIRDFGLKEPYVSTINLHSGEIADDLTYYFAQSEQTPSSVGLGVLFNKDDVTVKAAGGFIIQLMPHTEDSVISKIESNLANFTSVTDVLRQGKSPEELLEIVLSGFDIKFTEKKPVFFKCSCSKEKGLIVLKSLGKKTIDEMVKDNKGAEVVCDFCGKKYEYTPEEVLNLQTKTNCKQNS